MGIPALQDVSFSYISNTNLRGLLGQYLLRCCREEGLKRSDDGRATTWHRYVWQTSILPGLSKTDMDFPLAWTVTQQGKELLKWCFVQGLRSLWKSSSQSATTTKLCINKFPSSPYKLGPWVDSIKVLVQRQVSRRVLLKLRFKSILVAI